MRASMREGAAAFRWAAALPLLCGAHCAVSPFLVVAAPMLALPEAGEALVKLVSAVLAVALLVRGVRRHGSYEVAVPVLLGLLVWGAGAVLLAHGPAERVAAVTGGLLLAVGMFLNARLLHRATCHCCARSG